jgi:hypothetical protein
MGWPQHNETQDGTGGQAEPHGRTDIRIAVVPGAAADTNIAITGIQTRDVIINVQDIDLTVAGGAADPVDDPVVVNVAQVDRTSTTTITSAGNIQCSVDTTGGLLFVLWADRSATESHVAGSGP